MSDPFDSPVPYLRWAWQHSYELAWLRYVARLRTRPDMLDGTLFDAREKFSCGLQLHGNDNVRKIQIAPPDKVVFAQICGRTKRIKPQQYKFVGTSTFRLHTKYSNIMELKK